MFCLCIQAKLIHPYCSCNQRYLVKSMVFYCHSYHFYKSHSNCKRIKWEYRGNHYMNILEPLRMTLISTIPPKKMVLFLKFQMWDKPGAFPWILSCHNGSFSTGQLTIVRDFPAAKVPTTIRLLIIKKIIEGCFDLLPWTLLLHCSLAHGLPVPWYQCNFILRNWKGLDIHLSFLYSYSDKCLDVLLGKYWWGIWFSMFVEVLQNFEKHVTKPSPYTQREVKIYLLNGEVSNNLWKDFNTTILYDSGKNVWTTEFYFSPRKYLKDTLYYICPICCFISLRLGGIKNKK